MPASQSISVSRRATRSHKCSERNGRRRSLAPLHNGSCRQATRDIKHYEALLQASTSDHVEVREGIAIGLRDIFFDGLDVEVADWLLGEGEPVVQDALLEHMAVHAGRSTAYREEIMRAFRAEANGSVLRNRLEAANRDPAVSLEMRRIALQMSDPDLFASMMGGTVNNTINIGDKANIAGISNSGPGNSGQVIITNNEAQVQTVTILRELLQALESPAAREGAAEGANLTKAAIAAPNKTSVERVIGWLETAKKGGQAVVGVAAVASKAHDALKPLLDFLT